MSDYSEVYANANKYRHERDEARRWARYFMYKRDNWHANYNFAIRLFKEREAENAALRRELEALRQKEQPHEN